MTDITNAQPATVRWSQGGNAAALLLGGLVLAVVGAVLVGYNWPSAQLVSGLAVEDGSWVAVSIGALLGLTGQLMIAVSVIAIGVRMGNAR